MCKYIIIINLLLYLRGAVHKLVGPELVNGILDEFYEGDEQPPRVRSVDDESLEEHPGDLLLHCLRVGLSEQVQKAAGEIVRVTIRIAKLIRDRVQKQISRKNIHINIHNRQYANCVVLIYKIVENSKYELFIFKW